LKKLKETSSSLGQYLPWIFMSYLTFGVCN